MNPINEIHIRCAIYVLLVVYINVKVVNYFMYIAAVVAKMLLG